MKNIVISLRVLVVMTLLTGGAYPLLVTLIGQGLFAQTANGSLQKKGEQILGSSLIAQKFSSPHYFWPRPSGVDYATLGSGGSNLGQASADLKKAVDDRTAALQKANPEETAVPGDLVFASGSGLDPDLSPEAAQYQVRRIAKARAVAEAEVSTLVQSFTKDRQFGILGEPTVNVMILNLALDEKFGVIR